MCIVSDGRAKINSRTLSVLAAMGIYQDGVAKNVVAGKPVTAHIYEYTTQSPSDSSRISPRSSNTNAAGEMITVSIDPDLKFKSAERCLVPVQVIFCLKEKNAKKLNSHRWALNAFAPILQPNIWSVIYFMLNLHRTIADDIIESHSVLLDVGTQPGPTSIYKLWKTCVIEYA